MKENNIDMLETFKKTPQKKGNDFAKIEADAFIDLTAEIAPPEIALSVRERIWGTLGNFTVVMGKAKAKKTFVITAAIAAATGRKTTLDNLQGHLSDDKRLVLWFDTEQGRYHVQKAARRAMRLSGLNLQTDVLKVYALRNLNTDERFKFINWKINNAPGVGLVVIDGIRDLLRDINSPEEATIIGDALLKWTSENNIHIITVLHANKTDGNLRGHVGTELLNKAEAIIDVSVAKQDKNVSIVSCERSKNQDFEEFAFHVNDNSLPEICDIPRERNKNEKVKPQNISDDGHKEIMIEAISKVDSPIRKGQLLENIAYELDVKGHGNVGRRVSEQFLIYWVKNKWVKNQGTEKSSNYVIKKYPV